MNLAYLIAARGSSYHELRHSSSVELGMHSVYLRQNVCVLWLFRTSLGIVASLVWGFVIVVSAGRVSSTGLDVILLQIFMFQCLKESFKLYSAINDGIINLVDKV